MQAFFLGFSPKPANLTAEVTVIGAFGVTIEVFAVQLSLDLRQSG